jgi:hypothetical protein
MTTRPPDAKRADDAHPGVPAIPRAAAPTAVAALRRLRRDWRVVLLVACALPMR